MSDFKIVAHSEEKSKAWQPKKKAKPRKAIDRQSALVAILIGFAIICMLCIFGSFTAAVFGRPDQETAAIVPVVALTRTDAPPPTRDQPTAEPAVLPPTAWPTPEPTQITPDVQIRTEYETIILTQEIEVTRIVIHTATVLPPTPDFEAMREADAWDREQSEFARAAAWEWIAIGTVIALVVIFLILGAYIVIKSIWHAATRPRVTVDDNETTPESIRESRDGGDVDIAAILKRSIAMYTKTGTRLAGFRDVDGMTGEAWTAAIEKMESSGISIARQSGVGTVLIGMNLRQAQLKMQLLAHSPRE